MQSETARKLSEIFTSAGKAFTQMAELTMQLQNNNSANSAAMAGKWTDSDVDMLKGAVERFGTDLDKIGSVIKTRTEDQLKRPAPAVKLSTSPAKGNENVPVMRPVPTAQNTIVEEKKPRLPPPSSISGGGPVIRTVANAAIAPVGIAPPLVLTAKPGTGAVAPVKEQKARRGGGSSSAVAPRPGPASRTQVTVPALPQGGPKLASMLESGKRPAPPSGGLTEYQRLKLMREAEEDDYSGSDSDDDDLDDDDLMSDDDDD